MKKNILNMVSVLALAYFSAEGIAAEAPNAVGPAQQAQMEKVIHDYLVNHPEVLIEASQALQKKQQVEMQAKAQSAIQDQAAQLFNKDSTYAGNAKGNVTLVEFFDYQCSHCKKMKPVISNLIEKNKDLTVIYKEFPIFGKSSEFAAQAALAAAKQGKYQAMQNALLSVEKPLTEALVLETAKKIGLNVDQLKKDMSTPAVRDELAANRALAEKMHLMGTPAFVIAYTPNGQFDKQGNPAFVPGGASEETLQGMINQLAKK